MKLQGRAWKFGSNIETDAILPARYLNVSDPEELAQHCMEDVNPQFVREGENTEGLSHRSNA